VVSELRVEGAESEGEENLVVGSKRKLTEMSEVDQPRMGFITSSQIVPVAQCDDHTHTYEFVKILESSRAQSYTQCDIVASPSLTRCNNLSENRHRLPINTV
jgi:hypothetical protein